MINVSLQVRHAVAEDYQQISNLIFYESNVHRHLDWRSPLDWIGFSNYWVLEDNGHIIAALACPEDPPQVAWLRIFGHHPRLSGTEAWSALWKVAHGEVLRANPQTQITSIVTKQWFQTLLLSSGFELKQNIVLLQLANKPRSFSASHGFRIRSMQEDDLPAVTQVDLDSFGWFWHNTSDSLKRARQQAVSATVAEDDSGVIGYQLSTGNPFGAHLARLAVKLEMQGRGIGTALVEDLIHTLGVNQISRLSVNTQSDNATSLALYKKIGFVPTGEYFPVLVYPIDKGA